MFTAYKSEAPAEPKVFGLAQRSSCMAKRHGRRRSSKFRRYLKGNIGLDISLGALDPDTGIIGPTNTVVETARCSSVKAIYSLSGGSAGPNEGPILVLVTHSDYSLAEIDAWIEQTDSWQEGNKVAKEVSSRWIRKIGILEYPVIDGEAIALNDGKPITTKLNWNLITGQGLNFVGYNLGSATLTTPDPNLNIQGHANLWPR